MLAGAAAFAHPSTRMFAGLAGGAAITASRASVEDPNLIDATSLDSSLETALDACHTALKDSLSLAVGGGGEYNDLPYQQGDYSSAISRFFHDGQFLIQGQPEELFSEGYTWLTRALVAHGLNDAGYTVIGEKDVTESWCTSENVQGTYGARWFSDVEDGRCFKLYSKFEGRRASLRHDDFTLSETLANPLTLLCSQCPRLATDTATKSGESPTMRFSTSCRTTTAWTLWSSIKPRTTARRAATRARTRRTCRRTARSPPVSTTSLRTRAITSRWALTRPITWILRTGLERSRWRRCL